MNSKASIIAMFALLVAIPLAAQTKLGDPLDTDDLEQKQAEALRTKLAALREVWGKAREPRIAILCGVPAKYGPDISRISLRVDTKDRPATSRPTPGNHSVVGVLAPFRFLGDELLSDDPYGYCNRLRVKVSKHLTDAGLEPPMDWDTELERRGRQLQVLRDAGEHAAIEALFAELGADIVLVLRVQPIEPGENGPRVSIEMKLCEPGIGTSIRDEQRGPWTSKGNLIDDVAALVTGWFADALTQRLSQRISRGGRIAVKLLGIDGGLAKRAESELLQSGNGIESANVRSGSSNVFTMDVRFAGDSLSLYEVMNRVFQAKLDRELLVNESIDGAITLKVRALRKRPARLERWEILLSDDAVGHAEVMAELKAANEKSLKPRIGIVINKEMSEAEKKGIGDAQLKQLDLTADNARDAYLFAYTGRRATDATDVDQRVLDTRSAENLIYDQLGHRYKLNMVDMEQSTRRIREHAAKQGDILKNEEMEKLFSQMDGVDMAIQGVGSRINEPEVGYRYTFRAVRVSDGQNLANATETIWAADLARESSPLEQLAARVAAKLVDRMMEQWTPPKSMLVRVENAPTQQEVLAVIKLLNSGKIPGIRSARFESFEGGAGKGLGLFYIETTEGFTRLTEQIQNAKDELPFDLGVGESTKDALSLRLRPEFLSGH